MYWNSINHFQYRKCFSFYNHYLFCDSISIILLKKRPSFIIFHSKFKFLFPITFPISDKKNWKLKLSPTHLERKNKVKHEWVGCWETFYWCWEDCKRLLASRAMRQDHDQVQRDTCDVKSGCRVDYWQTMYIWRIFLRSSQMPSKMTLMIHVLDGVLLKMPYNKTELYLQFCLLKTTFNHLLQKQIYCPSQCSWCWHMYVLPCNGNSFQPSAWR